MAGLAGLAGLLPAGWARWRPAAFGAAPAGQQLARVRQSPQYRDGAFRNPLPTRVTVHATSVRTVAAQLAGWRGRHPGGPVPVHRLRAAELAAPPVSGLRLTWLGHSTVLAEIDGCRVLFDPVFSRHCSPLGFIGPRRHHPVPVPLSQLPPVDVVVISHDHYDHLDMPTIRALAATPARFAVPLGVGAHLRHWGIAAGRITELDWHQSAHLAGLTLTATPARHSSGRGLRPARTALWCSWVVAGARHRVFHGGDSGYFPALAGIGAAHGPFDATMLPIGAYHRLWPDVHMTPEQAVQAHVQLRGRVMLPIHWATYGAPHCAAMSQPHARVSRPPQTPGAPGRS